MPLRLVFVDGRYGGGGVLAVTGDITRNVAIVASTWLRFPEQETEADRGQPVSSFTLDGRTRRRRSQHHCLQRRPAKRDGDRTREPRLHARARRLLYSHRSRSERLTRHRARRSDHQLQQHRRYRRHDEHSSFRFHAGRSTNDCLSLSESLIPVPPPSRDTHITLIFSNNALFVHPLDTGTSACGVQHAVLILVIEIIRDWGRTSNLRRHEPC